MASKYKDVLPKLKPVQPQTPEEISQRDMVNAVIEAWRKDPEFKGDGTNLAKRYAGLRKVQDDAKQALSDANLAVEAALKLLVENNEKDDPAWGAYGASPETLRMADGSSVRLERTPYMQIKNKEAYRLWCIKQRLENIMYPPWQTVNAMSNKMLLNGEEPPDGTEVYYKDKAVYTPVKKAKTAEEEYAAQAALTDELESN